MGWIGFALIGGGIISVWAGFEGVALLDVVRSVLTGTPLPSAGGVLPATTGSTGGSGLTPLDPITGTPTGPNPGSTGDGVSGGGGGGW